MNKKHKQAILNSIVGTLITGTIIGIAFYPYHLDKKQKNTTSAPISTLPTLTPSELYEPRTTQDLKDQYDIDLYNTIRQKCGQNITKEDLLECMIEANQRMEIRLPADLRKWTQQEDDMYLHAMSSMASVYYDDIDAKTFRAKLRDKVYKIQIKEEINNGGTLISRNKLTFSYNSYNYQNQ